MKAPRLQIISANLLPAFLEHVPKNLQVKFDALEDAEISTGTFSFYTSVSSVFSSKIEGEDIELDNYIKHKRFGIGFLSDYTKKVDDLYDAYRFAQSQELKLLNIAEAHRLLSKHILESKHRGVFRTQHMYVTTPEGRIEYVAVTPGDVETEMKKLFEDISTLLRTKMSLEEVFYYAAYLHLVFVKIHPWNDGNGRSARLIEKWFLAEKAGKKAWFLQSEKMYYKKHQEYYKNLRILGLEYSELNYGHALPFLLMLPGSADTVITKG